MYHNQGMASTKEHQRSEKLSTDRTVQRQVYGRRDWRTYISRVLTAPLRALTKKYAGFRWGKSEDMAFNELKKMLCSDKVLMPNDLSKKTRLYVDSSPVGTQATVCQLYEGNH